MTTATREDGGAGERAVRWIYGGLWRVLVDWFRVPRRSPSLPVASDDRLETFRPDAGFLGYLKFWFWLVTVPIDLLILIAWIALLAWRWWAGLLALPLAVVLAILPDVIAYVAIHLRFDTTWYVMTQRSLRIRRGVWLIHEMTITFENVQNVKIRQGPVQRFFGISTLLVETAGGGGESGQKGFAIANRGIMEGVADAERLRDLILVRLRKSRSAGLGDEGHDGAPGLGRAHIAVLREIRDVLSRQT